MAVSDFKKGIIMLIDDIRSFLNDYFDVLQNQNLDIFDRVFHPGCVLYSAQDGVSVVRPKTEYRQIVQGRVSPEAGHFPRLDEILMVDVMSAEMALVKVRLRLFDNIMVDYLNLMRVDEKWVIVAKHFHKAGNA
jgi:hypothetical protein